MPANKYYQRDGTRVPGASTVAKLFTNPDPLMWWSWNVAYKPLEKAVKLLSESLAGRPQFGTIKDYLATDPLTVGNYRHVRDTAAGAGSLAHAMLAKHLVGLHSPELEQDYPTEQRAMADQSFRSALLWLKQTGLEVVSGEEMLVSEQYAYGGMFDGVAVLGGSEGHRMADWKTGAGVYESHLVQLAGYGRLWEEHNPDKPIVGYDLIRFDRVNAEFHHHSYTQLDDAWELFKLALQVREILPGVRKRAK